MCARVCKRNSKAEMKPTHALVSYLMLFFILAVHVPNIYAGEYHSEYASYEPKYEAKQYEYHHHDHHDHHPPPAKKSGHVDINIPFDFGTIAKLGVLGLTQLKLLLALGKVAGAGLGVSALGLGQLGKIALKISPGHKGGGIAIDVGAGHHHHEAKSHSHYDHEKHY